MSVADAINHANVTLADLAALNYTALDPYDGTIPTGGDSLNENLNRFYTVCSRLHNRHAHRDGDGDGDGDGGGS